MACADICAIQSAAAGKRGTITKRMKSRVAESNLLIIYDRPAHANTACLKIYVNGAIARVCSIFQRRKKKKESVAANKINMIGVKVAKKQNQICSVHIPYTHRIHNTLSYVYCHQVKVTSR